MWFLNFFKNNNNAHEKSLHGGLTLWTRMEALKFKAWVCTLRVALLPSRCCTKRILLPPPLDPHICIWFFALCFALALKIQIPSTDQSYWVLFTRARRSFDYTEKQRDRDRFGSWWVEKNARFLLHVPLWVPGVDRRLVRFFEERQQHLVDGRSW